MITVRKRVGPRGQIVIPKLLRDALGIGPGDDVLIEVRGGEIVIRPGKDPEKFLEEFCGVVRNKLRERVDLERMIEEEVEERFALR